VKNVLLLKTGQWPKVVIRALRLAPRVGSRQCDRLRNRLWVARLRSNQSFQYRSSLILFSFFVLFPLFSFCRFSICVVTSFHYRSRNRCPIFCPFSTTYFYCSRIFKLFFSFLKIIFYKTIFFSLSYFFTRENFQHYIFVYNIYLQTHFTNRAQC